jgi:hypothetical protein
MVLTLAVGGILAGIAAIIFFEIVGVARDESGKLHDRYHE